MTVRYLTETEVEKLAGSIWYAPKTKATRYGDNNDKKYGTMPAFGLESRSTEFPMRSGEWQQFGKYEVMIEYPMWDIPGKVHVRKHVETQEPIEDDELSPSDLAAIDMEPTKDEEHCYKDWCQGEILGHCQSCGRAGCTLHLTMTNLCDDCYRKKHKPQPETLYAVADDRLALPVHYLTPNAVSPEWYSPKQFSGIKEASDAFVVHHGKPARYVDPYQFGVLCKLRMEEWESVPSHVDRYRRYHDGLAAFCLAVAMIAVKDYDPFELEGFDEVIVWEKSVEALDKWEAEHPEVVATV